MAKRPNSSQTTTAGSRSLEPSRGATVRTTMPVAMMQTICRYPAQTAAITWASRPLQAKKSPSRDSASRWPRAQPPLVSPSTARRPAGGLSVFVGEAGVIEFGDDPAVLGQGRADHDHGRLSDP